MSDYPARMAILEVELDEAKARIRELEKQLGLALPAPLSFQLTEAETRVFGVIMARPVATKEAVMTALYSDRHEDEVAQPKIADVFVCKMRAKLKPYGVKIETLHGQGWRMSAENKAVVRAVLKQEAL